MKNLGPKCDLLQRFSLKLKDLRPDQPLLLACSGGRDSVALFDLLRRLDFSKMVLCHLNHALRGLESDRDEEHVQHLAKISRTRIISEKLLLNPSAASLEAAARTARYGFLAKIAEQTGIFDVLLAHHADDQAETVLWNLLRGSGSAGLGAMQTISTMRIGSVVLHLHRPLLPFWRAEIAAYVQERGLQSREDASNASTAFTRNQLRLEIIPWLEKQLGRNVRQPLWQAAEIAQAENAWLAELTGDPPDAASLAIADFAGQPLAWQRRRIHAWLVAHDLPQIGFQHVEAIRSLLDLQRGPARVNLPGNWQARRRAGQISLVPLHP